MPHIDLKCYPKHLTPTEQSALRDALVSVAVTYLKAQPSDVSIRYTEIAAADWEEEVWDPEILPHMDELLKKPGYRM
jgi:4-oxalocrotonate tautomerase